uniref:Isoform 4 of Nck-associated protein 5-like n=1 Tax=Homo sapiens TaxID=9606 RepID=Q9HCH0-4
MSEAMDQPAGGPGNPRPGEGDDGSMEPGTCQELLHRLRELEAENSALAQANENQRETYERCLDEVCGSVVGLGGCGSSAPGRSWGQLMALPRGFLSPGCQPCGTGVAEPEGE